MIPDTLADNGHYVKEMPDKTFSVDIFLKTDLKEGAELRRHWHEQLQLYLLVSGTAWLECAETRFYAAQQDIVVINSSEPHYLKSCSDDLALYIIRLDIPFLFSSQVDLCQTKFIAPLAQNRLTFENHIQGDSSIYDCVSRLIGEYTGKAPGYELAVKAALYSLIVLLLRSHVSRIMTKRELDAKTASLQRFNSLLTYINSHYTEKITVQSLSHMTGITEFHFCRVFKQLTGCTFTEYVNRLRLEKAAEYLQESTLSVTDIAFECGFESINYFSRLFTKLNHDTPSGFRKKIQKHSLQEPQ
jgi:AraC-like DNA-binding protein